MRSNELVIDDVDNMLLNIQRLTLTTINHKLLSTVQSEALDGIQSMLDAWSDSGNIENCDECDGVEGQHYITCTAFIMYQDSIQVPPYPETKKVKLTNPQALAVLLNAAVGMYEIDSVLPVDQRRVNVVRVKEAIDKLKSLSNRSLIQVILDEDREGESQE